MNNKTPKQNPQASMGWSSLIWLLLLMLAFAYLYTLGTERRGETQSIPYSGFKQELRADNVAQITIRGQEITGEFKKAPQAEQTRTGRKSPAAGAPSTTPGRRFATTMPPIDDPELMQLLERRGVTVYAEEAEAAWWVRTIVSFLPWMLLLALIFYASWKMQQRMMGGGPGGGVFGFGKSRARRFREGSTGVGFEDVAGLENAKADLLEIVDYLKDPRRYQTIGAKVPKGVLLMGAPGTGKTLLAKAVAGEADVPFYSISGSEFVEMFVGVGAARVRDMFTAAKQESPAIIFIDEIDAVGRSRGAGLGGGHDEREQTLNQILSEMDGFAPHENVVVLAATNRPDVLDPALLRPGRFDRKVILELPGKEARRRILEIHMRKVPRADDVDLEKVAARTVGFSGADLENLVNEAALLAGRERKQRVDMRTLERARDKIILGAERETPVSDQDKKVIAYHESGHALIAWLLPNADPLGKVTVIPRGHALGATEQTPEEDRYNLNQSYLLARLGVMLGGRVSEKIVFGELSSGAEADLKQATQLARRMICRWGMSERLGPVAFRQGEEHVFLGREIGQQRDFSERTAELIDAEIRRLITDAEREDEKLLQEHRQKLDALAQALRESETLEREEIEQIFRRAADQVSAREARA